MEHSFNTTLDPQHGDLSRSLFGRVHTLTLKRPNPMCYALRVLTSSYGMARSSTAKYMAYFIEEYFNDVIIFMYYLVSYP